MAIQSERPEASAPPAWEVISERLAAGDVAALRKFVAGIEPGELPRVLSRLRPEDQTALLGALGSKRAARLLQHAPDVQVAELLRSLEPGVAAGIVGALRSNVQADVLGELAPADAAVILGGLDPAEAAAAKRLAEYPDDTAGGIMITEYSWFPEHVTVGDVLDDLRTNTERYRQRDVQYIYVTDNTRTLLGVLRLRDLVLTTPRTRVREIMVTQMFSVPVTASLQELDDFFSDRPYRAVPVVDARGRLVGIARHADVAEALGEQEASDHLKAQGIVGGEELRTMPVFQRAWHRVSWLSINIVLNIIAASVIAAYQDTLAAVIVLAVFLPIVSDMSGCSGNQAVAVSMRELSLGLIRPADAMRVWRQEFSVGLINATVLGVILGFAAFLWQGNWALSAVVGGALALNTVVAVSLGGLVPLGLRALRLDPALASGPILTTVTDMCGFFFVLSFASAVLPMLQ